jgi:hypothetical protein
VYQVGPTIERAPVESFSDVDSVDKDVDALVICCESRQRLWKAG